MTASIRKIGAIISRGHKILVVKKSTEGQRTHYILPGGKTQGSEEPMETLRRELQEELNVELVEAKWFGRFQEAATFEIAPLTMDVYFATIRGKPSPHAEIQQCLWIDRKYRQRGILLGVALELQIIPKLIDIGIM